MYSILGARLHPGSTLAFAPLVEAGDHVIRRDDVDPVLPPNEQGLAQEMPAVVRDKVRDPRCNGPSDHVGVLGLDQARDFGNKLLRRLDSLELIALLQECLEGVGCLPIQVPLSLSKDILADDESYLPTFPGVDEILRRSAR